MNYRYQLAPPPFDEDDLRFWFFGDLLLPATKEAVDVLLLRVLCGLKSGLVDQLAPPPLPDDDAEEGERMLVLVCLFDELAVAVDGLVQLAPPPSPELLGWVFFLGDASLTDGVDFGTFWCEMPNDCLWADLKNVGRWILVLLVGLDFIVASLFGAPLLVAVFSAICGGGGGGGGGGHWLLRIFSLLTIGLTLILPAVGEDSSTDTVDEDPT